MQTLISPAWLGVLRALGVMVLLTILHFVGDAANLHGILNDSVAGIVAMVALGLEHQLEASTGTALFGAVKVKAPK